MENTAQANLDCLEEQHSSFFKNSCPSAGSQTKYKDICIGSEERPKEKYVQGGFTCCVPGCFNNSKRDKHLSFYNFPDGKSKEKQILRKKWIHMVCRKDFKPTVGHRVCSEHFIAGKKTYLNNVPTITPKMKQTITPRPTSKARNRELLLRESCTCGKDSLAELRPTNERCDAETSVESYTQEINAEISAGEEEMMAEIARLKKENCKLKEDNQKLRDENCLLVNELKENKCSRWFSVDNLKNDTQLFKFYTGLEDYKTFKALFESFGAAVNNLAYYNSGTDRASILSLDHVKRGPKRLLSPEMEFFLVLVRLRLGLLEADIANRVSLSVSHVSRICITWVDFLHNRLRQIPIWPSRAFIDETMPSCFRNMFPSTRVVIDCTELYIEMSSSIRSQSATYSTYKHHNTAKGLVGITPAGSISFVSDLYAGRTSDRQATIACGILKRLEKGDSVMADKGFEIANDLPDQVYLNIPPFLSGKDFLSMEEEVEARKIASVRIHVERAISRIKTFRILNAVFPITMAAELNKIWIICAYLTNFLPPLIRED